MLNHYSEYFKYPNVAKWRVETSIIGFLQGYYFIICRNSVVGQFNLKIFITENNDGKIS